LTKAAELGDVNAHYQLAVMYHEGIGVEKDEKRELQHLEEAAIRGHPEARYNLAVTEWKNERFDRAVKHLIIAANLGYDDAIKILKQSYVRGHVSKEDFAAALRAHQAAVNATKSPQREKAETFRQNDDSI
jgi:TPR repeat protein